MEEKEFMRVGGNQNIKVDVRLIAATNTDLEKRVREGAFRKDLLFRQDIEKWCKPYFMPQVGCILRANIHAGPTADALVVRILEDTDSIFI